MACIQFRFSTRVFAPHTSIGMYFGMYWYVLSTYWACFQIQYTLIPTWRPILMQVLWYVLVCIKFVLICMSTYMLVFDHKLIVNTPNWCHTALESTFNAIFTVDTAEMSLGLDFQSTLWQDGQRERPWQLPVPDLTTLSHSPPGEHCIQPALHAVWNGASNASWYQRQASRQAGNTLTNLCTNTVCKAVAGPPQLAFFRSVVPEGVCHRAVTVNQPLND